MIRKISNTVVPFSRMLARFSADSSAWLLIRWVFRDNNGAFELFFSFEKYDCTIYSNTL